MAGKGTKDLGRPPPQYNLAVVPKFETAAEAERTDAYRARMLRKQAALDPTPSSRFLDLADRLDPAVTDEPVTCASRRYMRERRMVLIGHLWRLYDEA